MRQCEALAGVVKHTGPAPDPAPFGCHKGSVLSAEGRSGLCVDERRSVMLYAVIDIHKHAFQAAVLDPESGEVVEERFPADRESLARWAERWRGPGRDGGDRGDDRLALGLARARRARLRGSSRRAGA